MRHFYRVVLMTLLLSVTQFVWTAIPVIQLRQTPRVFAEQTPMQALTSKALASMVANRQSMAWAMDEPNDTRLDPAHLPGGDPRRVFDHRRLTGQEEAVALGIPANQLPNNVRLPSPAASILVAKYDPLNSMGQVTLFKMGYDGGKTITVKAIQLTPRHATMAGQTADARAYKYYDSVWLGGPSCSTANAINAYWPVTANQISPQGKLASIAAGNPCLLAQGFSVYDNPSDGNWHVTEGGFRTLVTYLAKQNHVQAHGVLYVVANPVPGNSKSCNGGFLRKKCTYHYWVDLVPEWSMATPYVDGLGIENTANMVIPGLTGSPGSRMVWVSASAPGNNFSVAPVRVYDHSFTQSGWGFFAVLIFAIVICALAIATAGAALALLVPAIGSSVGVLGAALIGAALGTAVGTVGAMLTLQGANGMSSTLLPYADGSQSASAPSLSGMMAEAQGNSPGMWTDVPAVSTPGGAGVVALQNDLRRITKCVASRGSDCMTPQETYTLGNPEFAEIMRSMFYNPARRLIDDQRLAPVGQEANPYVVTPVPALQ